MKQKWATSNGRTYNKPILSYLLAMANSKANIDLYSEPQSCGAVRRGYKRANTRNVFLTVMMRMMTTMMMIMILIMMMIVMMIMMLMMIMMMMTMMIM